MTENPTEDDPMARREMIDFSKPIQTCHVPPRPARVVCTDAGVEDFPNLVLITRPEGGEYSTFVSMSGQCTANGPGIQNVPPPKQTLYLYVFKNSYGQYSSAVYHRPIPTRAVAHHTRVYEGVIEVDVK